MTPATRYERRLVAIVLLLLCACFLTFCALFVPRLTNAHYADVEFSGWSGPLGMRIVRGERPYADFVLPIPPGSFVLLAALQKLMGRALLLQELWLNAISELVMALSAYAIAMRLTTRFNALLVSVCSLVTLLYLNKECAYDSTAQCLAWVSAAVGVWALFDPPGARRARLWVATGMLAATTLAFKQSTGTGALLGWAAALGYLATVERLSGDRAGLAVVFGDARAWLLGAALGVASLVAMLAALGSPLGAYLQAVFVDAPALKGGATQLALHLVKYVTLRDAYPTALGLVFCMVLLGWRIVEHHGSLHIGNEPVRHDPLNAKRAVALGLSLLLCFGSAVVLLGLVRRGFTDGWINTVERTKALPHFGLVFGCAFFLAHFQKIRTPRPKSGEALDDIRAGHAINAAVLAILTSSVLHNTSAPQFRPFYDNNPLIALAFTFLFVATDRARAAPVKALLVSVCLVSLFAGRLDRAIRAKYSVGSQGYWAYMKVNEHGRDIVRVALQIRRLTTPDDTVLVLPEDVAFAALIGRPRPKIRGAIVFVDQYPARLMQGDLRTLRQQLPKVIVLCPAERLLWVQFFRIWSGGSAAQQVVDAVSNDFLPAHYVRHSRIATHWFSQSSSLEIWLRKTDYDGSAAALAAPPRRITTMAGISAR